MSKRILLQTTIRSSDDNWTADRFALLADTLRLVGHDVTARDKADDECDPVLSTIDTLDFDQLWLMAVDTGDGLSAAEAAAILRFRSSGRGLVTARDHEDVGSSLRRLGSIGAINHFHSHNPPAESTLDDPDTPSILWPNFHSGANGTYHRIHDLGHGLLRSTSSPSGRVEWFPAHPHEGCLSVPQGSTCAQTVARGTSARTGRPFDLVVAVDRERGPSGEQLGRAVCLASFHHLADANWDPSVGVPSFVTEAPGTAAAEDDERLKAFKDYVRNLATWL